MKGRYIASGIVFALGIAVRLSVRRWGTVASFLKGTLRRAIADVFSVIFGFFPFSLSEWLIVAAIVLVAAFLIAQTVLVIKRKKEPGRASRFFASSVSFFLLTATVVFFLFEVMEDAVFYAPSFASTYGFGEGSYDTEELAEECNSLADKVSRDEKGEMISSPGLAKRVKNDMKKLSAEYPYLEGVVTRPKEVVHSFVLSHTQITGVYGFYTGEANVNRDMTEYNIPFTMAHELAHTRGVMPEDEANLVAYLVCMGSDDADIRYSGALSGWIYCANELLKRDDGLWEEISSGLRDDVRTDLAANNRYWEMYETKVAEVVESLNDSYLKGHGVEEGTKSYDMAVDLIVSAEKKRASGH